MNLSSITCNMPYRAAAVFSLATILLPAQSAAPKTDAHRQLAPPTTQKITQQSMVDLDRRRLLIALQIKELQEQLGSKVDALARELQPIIDSEKSMIDAYAKQEKCEIDLNTMACKESAPPSAAKPQAK